MHTCLRWQENVLNVEPWFLIATLQQQFSLKCGLDYRYI